MCRCRESCKLTPLVCVPGLGGSPFHALAPTLLSIQTTTSCGLLPSLAYTSLEDPSGV